MQPDVTSHPQPQRIGPYTLLLEGARGGMATIFVAQRDGSKNVCALKMLRHDLEVHEGLLRRFQREAQLVTYLDHPNIARVIDAGHVDGVLYIAMEYIPGQTIDTIVDRLAGRGLRLDIPQALAIAMSMLEALAYAHELRAPDGTPFNLVHRDLSPRNIIVNFAGAVKIIDFGVARMNIDSFQTEPGILVGTLRYFSPEQARGDPVDARSDLYTTAVILYEMLTGAPLVPSGTAIDMLQTIEEVVPPLLSRLDPTIPRALSAVVARALAKKRSDRYSSAREMRRALVEAAGDAIPRDHTAMLARLMQDVFPAEEAKLAARIEEAQRRLPYDPSRLGAAPVADTFDDRTKTSVAPSEMVIYSEMLAAVTEGEANTEITHTRVRPKELSDEAGIPTISTGEHAIHDLRAAVMETTSRTTLSLEGVTPLSVLNADSITAPGRAPRDMPAGKTHVLERTKLVVRKRPLFTWGVAAMLFAAMIAAAIAAERLVSSADRAIVRDPEPKSPQPIAAPLPTATPLATPAELTPKEEPQQASAKSEPRRKAAEPAPQPKKPAPAQSDSLRRRIAQLRAQKDIDELMRLHDDLVTASSGLPDAQRQRVRAVAGAAARSLDVEGMARAVELLIEYEAAK
jgi:hypothetical protein